MDKRFYVLNIIIVAIVYFLISCDDEINSNTLIINSNESRNIFDDEGYYWHRNKKIAIGKKTTKEYVVYRNKDNNAHEFSDILESKDINEITGGKSRVNNKLLSATDSVDIIYKAPCFVNDKGKELAISQYLYVKIKEESDVELLKKFANEKQCIIVEQNHYMPLWYTLKCTDSSTTHALNIANQLYELDLFACCQPDIIGTLYYDDVIEQTSPNDSLYFRQWNLYNPSNPVASINYDGLSLQSVGVSSISIAILDSGIEVNHDEFKDKEIFSYDIQTKTNESVVYKKHATRCAGIIGAATNNGTGITGIAPNCTLLNISHPMSSRKSELEIKLMADAIIKACELGASILSCSWGFEKSDLIDDALLNAIEYGRNGLGTVVVFSAGNSNQNYIEEFKTLHKDFLIVGASNSNAERAIWTTKDGKIGGSCYGNALDVLAPGMYVPTTDSANVYSYATGTSMACPHVSAVAALVLSVNPYLTQKEVSDIIEKTATKLPAYQYSNVTGRPNGTWNNETGYGLLNAKAAVDMAMSNEYDKIVTEINNVTITSPRVYGGDIIKCEQVMVYPTGVLILSADDVIEIQPDFRVEAGGAFEFYTY